MTHNESRGRQEFDSDKKKSIVTIDNDDQLCMARAIGVGWAKLIRCTKKEWDDLTRYQKSKSQLELVLEHRKVPESYYKKVRDKPEKNRKTWQTPSVD